MYKKMLATIGLLAIAVPTANIVGMGEINNQESILNKSEDCFDLGTLVFLDSNHEVKDDKNVSESEAIESKAQITNLLNQELALRIPGAELDKDYTIDTSEIHAGDLSRAAQVFINAKEGSTLIKEGTATSAWVIYVKIDTRFDLGTIIFIDDNHAVKDDKNVSESEAIESKAQITNRIKWAISLHIPDAKIERDYTIDTSQIHAGDLSRGAEVFINAMQYSNVIKWGTFTSAWVIYVNR